MGNESNARRYYRIELSGWGLDQSFFVEQTTLLWCQDGDKSVALHRELADGAIVFRKGGGEPVAPVSKPSRKRAMMPQRSSSGDSGAAVGGASGE